MLYDFFTLQLNKMNTNTTPDNRDINTLLPSLLKYTLAGGIVLFVLSFGFLYLSFKMNPSFFETYLDPMFNAGGDRDLLFYIHPFVLAAGLAILWYRFRKYLKGNVLVHGIEFGVIYGIVALVPILWITYSAISITLPTVLSWLVYGTTQACIAGVVFEWLHRRKAA